MSTKPYTAVVDDDISAVRETLMDCASSLVERVRTTFPYETDDTYDNQIALTDDAMRIVHLEHTPAGDCRPIYHVHIEKDGNHQLRIDYYFYDPKSHASGHMPDHCEMQEFQYRYMTLQGLADFITQLSSLLTRIEELSLFTT